MQILIAASALQNWMESSNAQLQGDFKLQTHTPQASYSDVRQTNNIVY